MTAKTVDAPIDMAAVARVARRVGLQNIVLIGAHAERFPSKQRGLLEPVVDHDHRLAGKGPKALEIESTFKFVVKQAGTDILKATFVYRLFYSLQGDEPVDGSDAKVFALANGPYHAWPFVRELLFGMTSKMGLPPFILPVLTFQPPRPAAETPVRSGRPVAEARRRARVAHKR
ncbi:MAG: hypothetical protein IT348_18130 [Candidatus Eisenbacteria bacterium]|nr:hypothetical protein [Candidatus Eisenbacteria bacterium]